MRILLTNDDGIDAPGLLPFARALQEVGEVDVVVPDRERSWVSKAITRFDPVKVEKRSIEGVTVHACSGFPADCVQLGVNALFDHRPDLVVSGINIGYNHGAGYLQSSGTAGAALEAAIAGVPAVAMSTGSHRIPWKDWKVAAIAPESASMWERLAKVAAPLAVEIGAATEPGSVLNVGLPDDADETTPRRITSVAAVGYDRLFAEVSPGVYTHAYGGLIPADDLDGTDVVAARDGVISISPIRGAHSIDIAESIRRLEA